MYTKNNPTTSIDGKQTHCPSCGSYCNAVTDLDEQDYCNDCRPDTPENRLKEALSLFDNGAVRYDTDAIFKTAVDSLAKGLGPHAVLDSTLKQLSNTVNKLSEALTALERAESRIHRVGLSEAVLKTVANNDLEALKSALTHNVSGFKK
jgi:hypothetical protein